MVLTSMEGGGRRGWAWWRVSEAAAGAAAASNRADLLLQFLHRSEAKESPFVLKLISITIQ